MAMAKAWRGLACGVAVGLLAACLLSACGSAPMVAPQPTTTPRAEPQPAAEGRVLGRNDRVLVYEPVAGDTFESIAVRFLGSEAQGWQIAEVNEGVTSGNSNGSPNGNSIMAGHPLIVPLQPINPMGIRADQYQTVPILCYHRFSASTGAGNGGKMTVSAANFNAQLDWLARNDYHVIRLADLAGFIEGRQPLPNRSVVITIDDGYESVHRLALPLLRRYGFPATLFVYTDFIGAGSDALTWPQLQELVASKLVDVQAHSKSHRNLIERDGMDADAAYKQWLDAEVRGPRELLEKRLPVQVRHYAFPYGDANQSVLDTLARRQYQLALTVNPGGNPFFAQPLMLHRTMIYGDHDLAAFKLKLQTARWISAP